MVVVVRREGVRRGPCLYTVNGALPRALPNVRFVPASRLPFAARVRILLFALFSPPNRG